MKYCLKCIVCKNSHYLKSGFTYTDKIHETFLFNSKQYAIEFDRILNNDSYSFKAFPVTI